MGKDGRGQGGHSGQYGILPTLLETSTRENSVVLLGLHFGHYKAIAHSDILSKGHALKLTLISKTGSAPDIWARGLSIMLENIAWGRPSNKIESSPADGSGLQLPQHNSQRLVMTTTKYDTKLTT